MQFSYCSAVKAGKGEEAQLHWLFTKHYKKLSGQLQAAASLPPTYFR